MKLSRTAAINGTFAVVIVGAIAGGYVFIAHPFATASTTTGTQLTSIVQTGVVSKTITASGAITPLRQVSASFATSGTIATVTTAIGATVTAGDVIGTLDTTNLKTALTKTQMAAVTQQASLAGAATDLVTARAALVTVTATAAADTTGKSADLVTAAASKVASSITQVDTQTAQLFDAKDAVATAKTNLAAATLTAPISGLVVAVTGTVGGSVSSGTGTSTGGGAGTATTTTTSGFATIADISQETMTANVAEADIAKVTVGQTATLTFPALTGVTATAKVTAISPVATSSNSVVTYATTITLDAIPAGLRLGQTAAVTVTTATSAETSVYVPNAAITTANGVSTVKVLKSGKSTTTTVTLGIVGDAGTQIATGVTAGETVVIGTVAAASATTTTRTPGSGFGGRIGGYGPPAGAGTR